MGAPCETATGEAPGRLDFLGGVADYSGSLVLEKPIRATTRVTLTRTKASEFQFHSTGIEGVTTVPRELVETCADASITDAKVRQYLDDAEVAHWVRYPLGCYLVLRRSGLIAEVSGLRLEVNSRVPRSMGVSSSAALEVATLRALRGLYRIELSDTELAHRAQEAENEIVGAPCGLMDQLAVSCAQPGQLLPILCRPDHLHPAVTLPEDVSIVGWPSGVAHAVSGNPYLRARTATFAALALYEKAVGERFECPAAIPPAHFWTNADRVLSDSMPGRELTQRVGALPDSLIKVYPDLNYALKASLAFPIQENARAEAALGMLCAEPRSMDRDTMVELGQRLFEAHEGYSSIGLGHPRTDAMVQAVRELGPNSGVYGARVSGGGSGGTVVVLLRPEALPVLRELASSMTPTGANVPELIE
ncbi:MAG: hypothetical protein ACFB20_07220 [Opitutales bacterium]